MSDQFAPGLYRHSKSGRPYILHFIETDSETLEERVSYQAEYGERKRWTRPARMWNEVVEIDGAQVPRFVLIDEDKIEKSDTKSIPGISRPIKPGVVFC